MIVGTLTGVVAIAIATQMLKSLLEAGGLDPLSRWHDPIVWLIAFASGIVGYVVNAAISAPLTGPIVRDAAGQGLVAALAAVGTYHLVNHAFFGDPPAPAAVGHTP